MPIKFAAACGLQEMQDALTEKTDSEADFAVALAQAAGLAVMLVLRDEPKLVSEINRILSESRWLLVPVNH
jgi:hypothetical protein